MGIELIQEEAPRVHGDGFPEPVEICNHELFVAPSGRAMPDTVEKGEGESQLFTALCGFSVRNQNQRQFRPIDWN
jgi:hypothetical protein